MPKKFSGYEVMEGVASLHGEPLSRKELLDIPVETPLWRWLRDQGVKRPTKSGKKVYAADKQVRMDLRLSDETRIMLEALSIEWNCTRPAAITRAIQCVYKKMS